MKHMYRIHTDSPRRFLIVQKNPNLKPGWVSKTLHGPHAHLNEWGGIRWSGISPIHERQ